MNTLRHMFKTRVHYSPSVFIVFSILCMTCLTAACSSDTGQDAAKSEEEATDIRQDVPEDVADVDDSAHVAQLILSPDPVEAFVTQTVQINFRAYNDHGIQLDDADVTWRVENAQVATVDESGLLLGLEAGQTTLSATSGDAQASLEVIVRPFDELERIEIIPAQREVGVGESLALEVEAYRADGTEIVNLNLPVDWHSDTPERATIDPNGLLSGIERGEVEVKATVGGLQARANFRVELKFKAFGDQGAHYAISTGGQIYWVKFNDSVENSDALWIPKFEQIEVDGDVHFKSMTTQDGSANCALSTDGRVYCWGQNTLGKLGADFQTPQLESPTLLETALRFESLAMGAHSTCGLSAEGSIYCWGDLLISGNYEERATNLLETHSYEPVLIDSGPFARIFMTRNALCAEETKTKRWHCMGSGEYGYLGNGSLDDQDELLAIGEPGIFLEIAAKNGAAVRDGICGIDEQLHIWCWGGGVGSVPQRKPWSDEMVDISPLGLGFCSATPERQIQCWGQLSPCTVGQRAWVPNSESQYYEVPQAAIQNIPEDWESLAGQCVLTEGGDIWCWGLSQSTGNPIRPLECEPSAQRVQTF
ncbi:Ig-like domain-containing protein [Bradymonas sediminis]|uniref:Uncharacterized protein n=1 Tax=Bradymonas sediminis TaxID=1548548 RepID=A0A2Z4FNC4_9DELT|nr:Ig-like domain-containing protein [Bradymonas sediminis]AWV90360.1 hypothetical protein DN745_13885 [Bradymonas sediminis]TDP75662.1 Ig-like protein group 2 [Bradymonas sediminis]